MDFSLQLSDTADGTLREAIVAPLIAYNASRAGASGYLALTVAIHDEAGAAIGGLWGGTSRGWLFTELLLVPEALPGRGVGREVMALAEAEAERRGCTGAWLDTFEFQARGFYERIGYTCFGELPKHPDNFARYFMQKSLGGATP